MKTLEIRKKGMNFYLSIGMKANKVKMDLERITSFGYNKKTYLLCHEIYSWCLRWLRKSIYDLME
jgi:hypothetical protein